MSERLDSIRRRMEGAARRAGREAASVCLVGVAKGHGAEEVREAARAGLMDVGENRVQEAAEKHRSLRDLPLRWHMVGNLQSNKARLATEIFELIHSVDSIDLARRLDRLAGERGKIQRLLLQADLAGEERKFGIPEADLFPALEQIGKLPHLRVEGLMLLPPFFSDPERSRPYFARLRKLRDAASSRGLGDGRLAELSMGMSHDFEVAIEEGATLVRVGTALFGERPPARAAALRGASAPREEEG